MTSPIFSHTGDTATAITHFRHPWYLEIEPPVGTQSTHHVRVTFLPFYNGVLSFARCTAHRAGVLVHVKASTAKPALESRKNICTRVPSTGNVLNSSGKA